MFPSYPAIIIKDVHHIFTEQVSDINMYFLSFFTNYYYFVLAGRIELQTLVSPMLPEFLLVI